MSDGAAATLLLVLRVKAFADADTVATSLGVGSGEAVARLEELRDRGLVQHRGGALSGWGLTAEGRRHGAELLQREVDSAGARPTVRACYQEFLVLNHELLAVCTAWQTVEIDGVHLVNDHSDPERDRVVLERLDALHVDAVRLLSRLGGSLWRFDGYAQRLSRAHELVSSGRTEWIARPVVDSYHSVWFELHEHLLVTLGLDRSSESRHPHGPTSNGDPS